MATENLIDLITSLSPSQQEAVREFVSFLTHEHDTPASPFLTAVNEFIEQHPELLRRLAS